MQKPHLPAWLAKQMRDQGGLAPGGLPNFRIVWGGDRLCVLGGKWRDHDRNTGLLVREVVEYRQLPKYPLSTNRWILEMWLPPEHFGSPEDWAATTYEFIEGQLMECLGPYPAGGEYELVKVLETPRGHFVPLTPTICEVLVATAKRNQQIPARVRVEARRARTQLEEKAKDQRMTDRIKELGQADMAMVPHIVVPSTFDKERYS